MGKHRRSRHKKAIFNMKSSKNKNSPQPEASSSSKNKNSPHPEASLMEDTIIADQYGFWGHDHSKCIEQQEAATGPLPDLSAKEMFAFLESKLSREGCNFPIIFPEREVPDLPECHLWEVLSTLELDIDAQL